MGGALELRFRSAVITYGNKIDSGMRIKISNSKKVDDYFMWCFLHRNFKDELCDKTLAMSVKRWTAHSLSFTEFERKNKYTPEEYKLKIEVRAPVRRKYTAFLKDAFIYGARDLEGYRASPSKSALLRQLDARSNA